jgi:hypothetical protein
MKKNVIILIILLLILFLTLWVGASGYWEFNSKKANIKAIKIFDKKLIRKAMMTNEENSANRPTMNETLGKSLLLKITEAIEIDEFVSSFYPNYFNFDIFNCKCSGDFLIVFEYQNGTEFQFALAHDSAIKMPGYRDWPVGFQAYNWLQKKGITNKQCIRAKPRLHCMFKKAGILKREWIVLCVSEMGVLSLNRIRLCH